MALRFKAFWLVIGFGFVVLVLFLSLTPDPPDLVVPYGLKIGHVLAYAWLMLWFAQIYGAVPRRVGIAAMLCGLGIGIEYLQLMTDNRTFSYFDMLLDAIGVAIGFSLACTRLQYGLGTIERMLTRHALPKA